VEGHLLADTDRAKRILGGHFLAERVAKENVKSVEGPLKVRAIQPVPFIINTFEDVRL